MSLSFRQVFALHPLYLSLDALSASMPADIQEQIDSARTELDQPSVDYEATMSVKRRIARALFDMQGETTLKVRVMNPAEGGGKVGSICLNTRKSEDEQCVACQKNYTLSTGLH